MKEGHIQLFRFFPILLYTVRPSIRPHGLLAVGTASYSEVLWFLFAGISLEKC
jgi:hypothetical protein